MTDSDSGQASSSSYADWWRYYCQYAQHAQVAQAQQTQGQASTYSTTTTSEQETYQVNYSAYQPASYTQAPSTTTPLSTTSNYKEPNKEGNDYYASYGYYSAAPSGVENSKVQESSVNYPADGVGNYANDNAQNAQLENLQKLVAQSVAEAVLKECSENLNISQQPALDKMSPDMDYERSRCWEGSWRGRGGRGRGKNGHSHFENRNQRRDYHSNDDGYWNKRKFNDGGGDYRSRRPDVRRGFSPSTHPRDAFRLNRYDGNNYASDKPPIHVPQRPLGPSNPAAVVQQQIEMMMKGGKNKRPRVYAPPPKSLTSQVYNAMKHPIDEKLKSGEAKDAKKDEKEPPKNDDTQQNETNVEQTTGSKQVGEVRKVPDDVTQSSIPIGYNPEKKYGEGYIQEVKAFHCHLCGMLLRWRSEVEEHVRSIQHYRLFKSSEECEGTDNKEVLSSENAENKVKEQVLEVKSDNKDEVKIFGEHEDTEKQQFA